MERGCPDLAGQSRARCPRSRDGSPSLHAGETPALTGRAAHASRASRPRSREGSQSGARARLPRRRYGAGLLASPGVPSPVSGSRTPRLPLLPVWEKGAGGMRGKRARERRREKGRQESGRRHAARTLAKDHNLARGCPTLAGVMRQVFWQAPACHLPFQSSGRQVSPFSPCGRRGLGG